jgi:putative transposase
MPVSSQNKRTTSTLELATPDPSSPVLPEQQVFHQYLRSLAQSAVRIVIETVMCEELDQFIGAAWGECTPKRKGYRNGSYTRDLVTATGRLEQINVPRDRAGQFHMQAFERYRRYAHELRNEVLKSSEQA